MWGSDQFDKIPLWVKGKEIRHTSLDFKGYKSWLTWFIEQEDCSVLETDVSLKTVSRVYFTGRWCSPHPWDSKNSWDSDLSLWTTNVLLPPSGPPVVPFKVYQWNTSFCCRPVTSVISIPWETRACDDSAVMEGISRQACGHWLSPSDLLRHQRAHLTREFILPVVNIDHLTDTAAGLTQPSSR